MRWCFSLPASLVLLSAAAPDRVYVRAGDSVRLDPGRGAAALARRIESRARPGAPFHLYVSQDPGSGEFWVQTSPLTPPGDYWVDALVERAGETTYRTYAVTVAPPLPVTARDPVVLLLNGYQGLCTGSSNVSTDPFGKLEEYLRREGRETRYINNCSLRSLLENPSIEELADRVGQVIAGLKYADGAAVEQVDVIAHSMGGLITRCLLSGKREENGVFRPPAGRKVRKAVFVGTPHFGTNTNLTQFVSFHRQVQEMRTGSRFLWDLATWNQGADDLREVDALAIAGNGGSYGGVEGAGDGLVGLTSAALTHSLADERVRIIPYCHTTSDLLHQLGLCPQPPKSIALVDTEAHPSWKIIGSFLRGGEEWKRTGHPPSADPVLAKSSGLFVAGRDEKDQWVNGMTGWYGASRSPLEAGPAPLLFHDFLPAGTAAVQVARGANEASVAVPAARGGYRTVLWKTGPKVAAAIPTAGLTSTLSLAPGAMISIYGNDLAAREEIYRSLPLPLTLGGTQVLMDGKPLSLYYAGPGQINAVLPEREAGYLHLVVKTAAGEHSWSVMLDAASPAAFSLDRTGSGAAAAVRHRDGQVITAATPVSAGDYVMLYVTGLGPVRERDGLQWAQHQPRVLIDGTPALVTFGGRAPGYPGLDQINLQIPATVRSGDVPLYVESEGHVSNRVTLAVR